MAKVWVLDTDTKGTGAEMVPLDKVERKPESKPRLATVQVNPPTETDRTDTREAPRPRRFKVVDVVSRRVLAEGVDARATLDVLDGVRSVVDISIYEWQGKAGKWRALTLSERRAFWALRERL